LEKKKLGVKHDSVFKPCDMSKTDPCNPLFKHDNEFDHTKKKSYRNADGKVVTGAPNILVNGPK